MSFYYLMHGVNPLAGPLLVSLNLYPSSDHIERFRDAALYNKDREESDYLIRVITRTGGANRPDYQECINTLRKHEYFLKEEDDAYDPSYMYFYFKLPPSMLTLVHTAREAYPEIVRRCFVDNLSLKEKMEAVVPP